MFCIAKQLNVCKVISVIYDLWKKKLNKIKSYHDKDQ